MACSCTRCSTPTSTPRRDQRPARAARPALGRHADQTVAQQARPRPQHRRTRTVDHVTLCHRHARLLGRGHRRGARAARADAGRTADQQQHPRPRRTSVRARSISANSAARPTIAVDGPVSPYAARHVGSRPPSDTASQPYRGHTTTAPWTSSASPRPGWKVSRNVAPHWSCPRGNDHSPTARVGSWTHGPQRTVTASRHRDIAAWRFRASLTGRRDGLIQVLAKRCPRACDG